MLRVRRFILFRGRYAGATEPLWWRRDSVDNVEVSFRDRPAAAMARASVVSVVSSSILGCCITTGKQQAEEVPLDHLGAVVLPVDDALLALPTSGW